MGERLVEITSKTLDAYRDAIATEATKKERERCLGIVAAVGIDWSDCARVRSVLNDMKQRIESGM